MALGEIVSRRKFFARLRLRHLPDSESESRGRILTLRTAKLIWRIVGVASAQTREPGTARPVIGDFLLHLPVGAYGSNATLGIMPIERPRRICVRNSGLPVVLE